MCSSKLKTDIHEETVSSPIFIQHTFIQDAKEVPHTISLMEMTTPMKMIDSSQTASVVLVAINDPACSKEYDVLM
jgi:hypothetical protein